MDYTQQDSQPRKQQIDSAKENYLKLMREIDLWQEEQGAIWTDGFQAANSSPRFTLEMLPRQGVMELWERLNSAAGEEVAQEELNHILNDFWAGKDVVDSSLFSHLQLALVGVAQLFRRSLNLEESDSDQTYGPCPVCGEEASIAILLPPVGKRHLHCLVCGHARPVKTTGCIQCGSDKAERQTYLNAEEFPGVEVVACTDCGGYFKQVDLREIAGEDLVWEDIRTLPLNYAAERWLAGQDRSTLN